MSEPGTDLVPDAPQEARDIARVSEDWSRMLLLQAKVKVLHASGVFPDLKSVAIGMTKAWAGEPYGLDPFAAQTSFDIINGKVEANANLHAAMVKRHPSYDFEVTAHDNDHCEITFYGTKRGDGEWRVIGVSTFSIADAEKAGLLKNQVWKAYPRSMTYARAMTNGVAWYCPDVMATRAYSEGEISGNERPPPALAEYVGSDTAFDVEPVTEDTKVTGSTLTASPVEAGAVAEPTTDEAEGGEGEGLSSLRSPTPDSDEPAEAGPDDGVAGTPDLNDEHGDLPASAAPSEPEQATLPEPTEAMMTKAQRAAIFGIGKNLGMDLEALHNFLGRTTLTTMTKADANKAIDELKAEEQARVKAP